ncbi:MAG: cytidine deaminase [Clostridia bacterium]|nr:cytidine deaminase [Clostridia bacterium]
MNKYTAEQNLIEQALDVRKNAYAPYSKFYVGAALLADSGIIYTGANAENSAYPVGICAERSAFAQALSVGERSFQMLAIVGGKINEYPLKNYCSPCGMCRQFISEFCDEDFTIILAKSIDDYKIFRLSELLPYSFHEQ